MSMCHPLDHHRAGVCKLRVRSRHYSVDMYPEMDWDAPPNRELASPVWFPYPISRMYVVGSRVWNVYLRTYMSGFFVC